MSRASRDEIRTWINEQYDTNEKRPTQTQIAAHFGLSQSHVSKILNELDETEPLPGPTRKTRNREDDIDKVYEYLEEYMAANTWAPSRREIAEFCELNLSTVNYIIAVLAARGAIEVGPQSRQIRFAGQ